MRHVLSKWVNRYFSDEQALALFAFLGLGFGLIFWMSNVFVPILVSVVIAYLLNGGVNRLQTSTSMGRTPAVFIVFMVFAAALYGAMIFLLPLIGKQFYNLLISAPAVVTEGKTWLMQLPEMYPGYVTEAQLESWLASMSGEFDVAGKWVLSLSAGSLSIVSAMGVYLVLVPILAFLFLKDGYKFKSLMIQFLPKDRELMSGVWTEMDQQLANYMRGKLIEMLIVGSSAAIIFYAFGLKYAALLALGVGFSVLIPFVGAALITVPIAIVGLSQWGMVPIFFWMMGAYLVLQMLDGNVLVPVLFSDAVNLHPITIIVAAMFFGALWGFWGVFLAIPLATLFKSVINAWPGLPNFTRDSRVVAYDAAEDHF